MQTHNVNVNTATKESSETGLTPTGFPMQGMQDIYYVIPTGEMSVEHFLALYTTVVKNGQDTQSIEALDVPGCQRLTLMSDHCPDTYQLMLKEGRPIAACDELAMTTWRIG